MVRTLVAGVGDFPEPYVTEEEQAAGRAGFGPLPAVREAVEQVARSLQKAGVVPGTPLQEPDRDALCKAWDDLRHDAPDEEPLIVHFAGHGTQASGSLYLVCQGGDPAPEVLDDTCVDFAQLLRTAENSGRPVLFLLDVCGAGQAIAQQHLLNMLADRAQDAHHNVWVIAACSAAHITYGARFTTSTAQILERLDDLDVSPTLKHVPVETLAAEIDREMALADRTAGQTSQDVVRTPHPKARLEPQPFLLNPAYSTDPRARLVTGLNAPLREFAISSDPGLDPLHFATRAAGNPRAHVIQFSGRTAELARIAAWIDNTDGSRDRLLVVTGSPGSGKSALLGVTVCLTHPDFDGFLRDAVGTAVRTFRPHPPGAILAVHARQLSLEQIIDSLHNQLDRQLPSTPAATPDPGPGHAPDTDVEARVLLNTPEALVQRLAKAGEVLLILDALDEADDPSAVLDQLLLPLSGAAGGGTGSQCRVMIGTRPWWDTLRALQQRLVGRPDRVLELDPATAEDRDILARDLGGYLNLLLDRRCGPQEIERIADQLARYSDSGAFLVATLYADHLLASAEGAAADPPRSITEVFDLQRRALAQTNPWIEPVLAVLGQVRGQGMPLDLIHTAALAHAPHQPLPPRLQDTRQALTEAAFYLRTTPDTDHRLLYRYFHQALTDHTAPLTDPATLYSALFDAIPRTQDDTPNWAHAHPYVIRHTAEHATATNSKALDRLLEDPSYLVYAEPDALTPHLHYATTEQATLHAHIYRTTTAHHPDRHLLTARRDLLTFDAACWLHPHLAHTFAAIPIAHRAALAEPLWATNRAADPAVIHTLKGHSSSMRAVATLVLPNGTPVAVTASGDGTAIVWNLVTGQRIHTFDGHTRWVNGVATLVLPDKTPVAVTASSDSDAIVWNLSTGERIHTLEGHSNSVNAVATLLLPDKTPVAITASSDSDVIVWNLITGRRRFTLEGHSTSVNSVASLMQPNGTPVAVTLSGDGDAFVWNLTTGKRRRTFEGLAKWGEAVATLVLPGDRPTAVSTSDMNAAIVWDLRTGKRIHTLKGHSSSVNAVATLMQADGTPVAVTLSGDGDGDAFVWNLTTGKRWRTLEGHSSAVHAVAALVLPDGTPTAITASSDRTAIVWNLSTGKRRAPLKGHTSWVNAVATLVLPDGTPVVVTASSDRTATVWNLSTGMRRRTFRGHWSSVRAVAALILPDGTPAAITAGDDRSAIVWSLSTGRRLHALEDHSKGVEAVATLVLPNGNQLAVTASDDGTAIVWDPATGKRRRTFNDHTGSVSAVAALMLPDGPAAITAGSDRTAIVWNPATGERIHTLNGHGKSVNAVAAVVLPDGPVAVTASSDYDAIVWNLTTGERIHTLEGHTNSVNAVATLIMPNGTTVVVTTGDDRTAIVWSLATGQPVWRLALPAEGRCVSATDAGFVIGCGREVAHFGWNSQIVSEMAQSSSYRRRPGPSAR
ncbi:WD40 repeat domain-containing protein [Streptomyces stelliscabiei]|uniref:WD40 repeat domain-containing protein n=1 Tax=Streptomyces stelliscabiei TaxID=146820 RepID=UPI002FF35CAB